LPLFLIKHSGLNICVEFSYTFCVPELASRWHSLATQTDHIIRKEKACIHDYTEDWVGPRTTPNMVLIKSIIHLISSHYIELPQIWWLGLFIS